ncbi:hypothetical protein D3C72_2209190 [compost metagenome]
MFLILAGRADATMAGSRSGGDASFTFIGSLAISASDLASAYQTLALLSADLLMRLSFSTGPAGSKLAAFFQTRESR